MINAWAFLNHWGARATAAPQSLRLCLRLVDGAQLQYLPACVDPKHRVYFKWPPVKITLSAACVCYLNYRVGRR